MNILLTGATGLLGNNLLRRLIADGHRVACLVRTTAIPPPLAGLECRPVYADLADPNSLDSADLPDFDCLIHAAAMIHIGWSRLAESRRINVESTGRLARRCRERQVRMLFVSTVDTLGRARGTDDWVTETRLGVPNPPCNYVVSKQEAEAVIRAEVEQGLDAVIVHPGFMLGPYDWKPSSGEMLLAIARQRAPFAPAGGCSAVDVRDVVSGILSAVQRGASGGRYILGGHNLSYLELWQMMAEVVGRRGPRRRLPNWLAAAVGRCADFIGKLRGREPLINSATVLMGQQLHYYCSDLAIRELGYTISPLRPAIEDAWQWFNRIT